MSTELSKASIASIFFLGAALIFNGSEQLWSLYQHWQQIDRLCAIVAEIGKDPCK